MLQFLNLRLQPNNSIQMQVLKFGGTSVGSANNINKVIAIIEDYAAKDQVACVVSAIGGITDKLLKVGHLAKDKNDKYLKEFEVIRKIHLTVLGELLPKKNIVITNALENKLLNLKHLLDGIFLINEWLLQLRIL